MPESLVTDPCRYLEDATDPATIAWTARENARTRAALDALPDRARLAARFEALTRIDSQGVPLVRGGLAFFTARRGDSDQPVLYVRDALGVERSLLDPAGLDPTGLTALDWWYPSPDGRYVAFGLSQGGDERSRLKVLEVECGTRLVEDIPDTRHCSLTWLPDESGFYYTRYPAGGDYDVRLYRHELGAPWAADPLVFGEGRKPEEWTVVSLSPDGLHVIATVYSGWSRSDAYVARAGAGPLRFEPLVEGRDAVFEPLPASDRLYVRTNDGAPRFRVYEVDYGRLAREHWREIVPEVPASLDGFALARGVLLLHYLVSKTMAASRASPRSPAPRCSISRRRNRRPTPTCSGRRSSRRLPLRGCASRRGAWKRNAGRARAFRSTRARTAASRSGIPRATVRGFH
jgi:prolyl oligopeptidase